MYVNEKTKVLDSEYVFETGKWAKQANGSVVLKWKNIVLMSNATAASGAKEGADFFPLTVDYREKLYAAGEFVGGFHKREGRPSTKEILICRLVDRPLRPLFPKTFLNELQIFITLLSADQEHLADVHAISIASASLMASNIPFDGPVAGVRVGRVDGELVLFPSKEQMLKSDIDIILAGTLKAVTMIEGSASEVNEETMFEAVRFGHEEIKNICSAQEGLRKAVTSPPLEVPEEEDHTDLESEVRDLVFDKMQEANEGGDKHARQAAIDLVFEETLEKYENQWKSEGALTEDETSQKLAVVKTLLGKIEVDIVRSQIFNKGIRSDKRKLDQVRPIQVELDVLPSAHGSAVFTRGETQSLGVVTLGSEANAQIVDNVDGESKNRFYLHYNFLPFSVGEVRRYGGPGRREIGHGKLAENALNSSIEQLNDFPYVIRIVSEILESNGSSSMATICSGSLALMDAGVPIKRAVAGIAMGLITEGEQYAILSDIAGLEDHFGDMDFKVAGTQEGITAFQLDTKVQGISDEIIQKALEQAKKGRLEILDVMNEAIREPRAEVSSRAPGIIMTKIDKSNIGGLIGPGGNNIRSLSEQTGAEIIVKDDGTVSIYSRVKESAEQAKSMIDNQFAEAKVGEVYNGTVLTLKDFGAFVEIMPGKSGLCHISKISHERVNDIGDLLSVGQKVKVKVIDVDRQGRLNLSIKDAS